MKKNILFHFEAEYYFLYYQTEDDNGNAQEVDGVHVQGDGDDVQRHRRVSHGRHRVSAALQKKRSALYHFSTQTFHLFLED